MVPPEYRSLRIYWSPHRQEPVAPCDNATSRGLRRERDSGLSRSVDLIIVTSFLQHLIHPHLAVAAHFLDPLHQPFLVKVKEPRSARVRLELLGVCQVL